VKLAGADLPQHKIDGVDIAPVFFSPTPVASPRESYSFYWGQELHAVRSGPWKLHFAHPYITVPEPGSDGRPGKVQPTKTLQGLYNLDEDVGEQRDVAAQHPEIVERLTQVAEQARADLGDTLQQRKGAHVRPAGQLAP
jgi:arylsulfatase A-like enzyme